MRTLRFLAAVLLVLPMACAPAPTPEGEVESVVAPFRVYSIDQFLETTGYRGASFSPGGSKLLVSSDQSGIFNAYSIPVGGGEAGQLTDSTTESILVRGFFPEDERFLYSSDEGGNELNHLYVQAIDGQVTDLTPGDELKAFFGGWSRDDASFYVATNERDPKFFDVYEYDTDDYERRLIYRNEDGHDFEDISPDRSTIAVAKTHTEADTDIYLVDLASGERRHLTPHEGDIAYGPQSFSPDGRFFYATTDEDSEFQYLVRWDLESGERETILEVDWDVSGSSFSTEGRYLVVRINADAKTEIRLFDSETLERLSLDGIPDADISTVVFSKDDGKVAFYVSSGTRPRDLYTLSLTEAGEPTQVTRSLTETMEPSHLVEGEVVRFASFDGVEIPGILYMPHRASSEEKVPALVWVHGGPGGQSRMGYRALSQYLVNQGYAIFAINNRGSSGYGKTFYHLDDRAHGEGDLQDCIASRGMLIDTGKVDPERIGIIGGSYGGYMVLAALAFEPEAFEVGVDLFGVANWVRTLGSIPPYWESFRKALEVEMGSLDDEEYLREISPLFHADQIVRPLIVLQGANDPRVLKVESDEMVEAARKNGATVEYVVFDDEGHGFRKKENQERGYKAILDFLDVHLAGKGEPVVEPAPAG